MIEEEIVNNNKKGRKVRLEASFYGKDYAIHIGKDVLRIIGSPEYICFKVNKDMSSFLVMPCEAKDAMSFQVPENIFEDGDKRMRVSSQPFVTGMLSKNGLELNRTYKVEGYYSENNNVVVFYMSDLRLYERS